MHSKFTKTTLDQRKWYSGGMPLIPFSWFCEFTIRVDIEDFASKILVDILFSFYQVDMYGK